MSDDTSTDTTPADPAPREPPIFRPEDFIQATEAAAFEGPHAAATPRLN